MVEPGSSSFLLCKVLRKRDPPIFITDEVGKQWLKKYHGVLRDIPSSARLEIEYGVIIRRDSGITTDATALQTWLAEEHRVKAELKVIQKWCSTEWSTSGILLTPERVEADLGVRLRLPEYNRSFETDEAATTLSQNLFEMQPAF